MSEKEDLAFICWLLKNYVSKREFENPRGNDGALGIAAPFRIGLGLVLLRMGRQSATRRLCWIGPRSVYGVRCIEVTKIQEDEGPLHPRNWRSRTKKQDE